MQLTNARIVAICSAVVLALVLPAGADYIRYEGMGLSLQVLLDADGTYADGRQVRAGVMEMEFNGTPITGYCVDIDQAADSGPVTVVQPDYLTNGVLAAYLFDTYAASVQTNTQAAALQTAIWEVLFETGDTLDAAHGYFRVKYNSPVTDAANEMLATLPEDYTPLASTVILASPWHQDVITRQPPSGVPEAGTLMLLAAGGPAAVRLGRRRRWRTAR